MLPTAVRGDRGSVQGLLSLFLTGFVAGGCVNLNKPTEVQMCAAKGICSDEPSKAPREDANKDVENAASSLPGDRSGSGQDAGEVNGATCLAAGGATPDADSDDAGADAVLVGGSNRTDATVVDDTVPANSPAGGPGAEQSGAALSTGPELGPEPGKEPSVEPRPEPPSDGGHTDSVPTSNCTIFYGSNPPNGFAGQPPSAGTLGAFCLATCDDIDGWGCSNFDGRTISVNGTTVSCGARVAKKDGYYVFRVSAGWLSYASIYWWGPPASTCPAPAGGAFP